MEGMLGRLGGLGRLLGDFWEYRLGLRVGGGCEGVAGWDSAITSSLTSRVKGQLGRRGGRRQDWLLQNICLLMELSLLQVGLNVLVKWMLELLLRV